MIKVIQVNRRSIGLGLLLLLGLVIGGIGFAGWGKGWLGQQPRETAPVSVTITQGEQAGDQSTGSDRTGKKTGVELPQPLATNLENLPRGTGFFVEYRMDRERARGMQVEILREVMASPSSDEDSRQTAHKEFLRISNNIAKEIELENLLRARGFQEAAVFLDHENVTVVLEPGPKMTANENEDIVTLVAKSTGVKEENVIMITMED